MTAATTRQDGLRIAEVVLGGYTRQSKGNEASTGEQDSLCRDRSRVEEWQLYAVYGDKVSASRYSKAGRDDWDRLLADLTAGRFNVLWLWECSRGDRKASAWAALLETCQELGVRIYVESDGRMYDPANDTDWRVLMSAGVDAEFESRKTSGRLLRHMTPHAEAGKPYGPCPYGYRRDYTFEGSKRIVHQVEDPETAWIVVEIFERLGRAEAISVLVRDFTERGLRSPSAGRKNDKGWHRDTIRRIAMNPAYIGKRTHRGQVYDGDWKALVTQAAFDKVQRVLSDPTRKTTRPGRGLYLLSHIAVCGECGGKVQARRRSDKANRAFAYVCVKGNCSALQGEWVDAIVRDAVIDWLSQPKVANYLDASSDTRVVAAREEAADFDRQIDEWTEAAEAGEVTPRSFAKIESGLIAKRDAALLRAAEMATHPTLREAISKAREAASSADPGAVLADWWDDQLAMATRREIIRILLSVTIHRNEGPSIGRTRLSWDEKIRHARSRLTIKVNEDIGL